MKTALTQTLTQRLQQRLSPLQMRFVRMLEMSEPEVEEEVRRELDDNPALERADTAADAEEYGETAEQMQMADYRADDLPPYRLEARNRSRDDQYFEPVAVAEGPSMIDQLLLQLSETDIPAIDLPIATYIIGNIDRNGYMGRTLPQLADDLAFSQGIEVAPERLRGIFDRIRALDPAGICATDLRDCLLLQLKRLKPTPDVELATEIVSHYFDLFSLRHFDRLESALGVDREALRRAAEVIRGLDPKPASRMADTAGDDRTAHIVPDFYVEADDDGTVHVTMPNNIPELAIEASFRPDAAMKPQTREEGTARRREALAFVNRKREEATDFIDLLRLRRSTLLKVMEAIVNLQRRFFVTEDEAQLRPMVLRDVAALTGFDISVISRATQGKYLATAAKTYPLKYFFNERVTRDTTNDDAETDSDDVSARQISAALREIVDSEDPSAPLTDEAILQRLKARGLDIARRTVAKYRDRLGIPVARLRKRL